MTRRRQAEPRSSTIDALEQFWEQNGGRENFPQNYVDVLEALLFAEDEVEEGQFEAARARLDAIFEAYPMGDPIWDEGTREEGSERGLHGTNVGDPVAYYGLRMLDEIANVGLSELPEQSRQIIMTIVIPSRAEGEWPTSPDFSRGEARESSIDPAIEADDYFIVRQSLRLFQHYIWAISGGHLHLEPRFVSLDVVHVSFQEDGACGIEDCNELVDQVPEEIQRETDFWWVIYPSNVPDDPAFDDVVCITGGMDGRGRAPLFICDDLSLVRKPPHLGRGPYTEVERRAYLPQWLQHEFFHHLFRTWPEFELEAEDHQWFRRETWPSDFEGEWEADFYAEALHKRLYGATPSIVEALATAYGDFDPGSLRAEDFVGWYERQPVENDWHRGEIVEANGELLWRNEAGTEWSLFWQDGALSSGPDCPYGEQPIEIEPERGADGDSISAVRALVFDGESYHRVKAQRHSKARRGARRSCARRH